MLWNPAARHHRARKNEPAGATRAASRITKLAPGSRSEPAESLWKVLDRAKELAWKGEPVERSFRGALEFASTGTCSLVFLDGEYVGEVAIDGEARERSLPRGGIRVYQPFNSAHRFHFISDPRRFAPGFAEERGRFPSRDTAAMTLLEALRRNGSLQRFADWWDWARSTDGLLSIASASVAVPWCRIAFKGLEFGWLMVDRKRSCAEGRWSYAGPPALDQPGPATYFRSRHEAALALIDEIRCRYEENPRRFDGPSDPDDPGSASWNQVAVKMLEAIGRLGGGLFHPQAERVASF